jgi:hypothetical protein
MEGDEDASDADPATYISLYFYASGQVRAADPLR